MKWEVEIPKDKYYVKVINLKWLFILHAGLSVVLAIMIYGAWSL